MSVPPYPAYKDSGEDWIGEVPASWDVCALNYRYEIALGKILDQKRITGEFLHPACPGDGEHQGAVRQFSEPGR